MYNENVQSLVLKPSPWIGKMDIICFITRHFKEMGNQKKMSQK